MKIVSAGSSFCLVPDLPQQSPNDDIRNGRKSPFISNRAWPKALRTRSASKERISSKQRYLQGPVEQMKQLQDKRVASSSQHFSRNLSDSEDIIVNRGQETCKNDFVTRSQSVHNVAALRPTSRPSESGGHRGILKKTNPHVPRVTERINNYQQNIQETNSKHQATLPWNTKICRKDSEAPAIRRAASSPCLFVKQSCVNIKTRKTPIKLFGTITSMGNLIEERLSNVLGKDPNHCINDDENVASFMNEEAALGNSPDQSHTASSQDDARRIYQSTQSVVQAPRSENNNIPSISSPILHSGLNTNQNFSSTISNHGKNVPLPPSDSNLHTWMRKDHSSESSRTLPTASFVVRNNRSGTEPREESASSKSVSSVYSRPPRSSLSPHHVFRADEAKLEKINSLGGLRFYEERSPPAPDPTCDTFCRRGDKNSMTPGVAEKGSHRGENVIRESEELSVRQRISNNPEHFNSSEDEEIQKELSSILTNGQRETDTKSVHRPRFLTNPMKYETNHGSKTFLNYAQSELTDTTSSDIEIASTEKLFADPDTVQAVRGNQISNSNDSKIQLAARNNSGQSDLNNNFSGAEERLGSAEEGKVTTIPAPELKSNTHAIYTSQVQSAAAVSGE